MRSRETQANELFAHLLETEPDAVQEQYLLLKPMRYAAAACALTAFALAAVALFGRFSGNFMLASYDEGYKIMVPTVGLCLLLIAVAVAALALGRRVPQRLLQGAGVAVMGLAGLRLVEFFCGADWGSSALFLSPPVLPHAPDELPYALPTALALFSAGLALLLLSRRVVRALSHVLAGVVLTVGAAFALGYVYLGPLLVGHRPIPLALPAAISMTLLGLALVMVMTAQELAIRLLFALHRRAEEAERDRLAAEAARQAAEVEAVFASMADGVTLYDLDGTVLRVNEGVSRILRFSAEQSRLPWDERLKLLEVRLPSGEPLPPALSPRVRAAAGEIISDFPLLVRRGDGVDVWLSLSAAPVRGTDGEITGAVVTFHDTTELVLAQQEAHRRASELEAIIDSIADGVAIYDAEGRMLRSNAALRTLIRYTDAERDLPVAARFKLADPRDVEGRPLDQDQYSVIKALRGETFAGLMVTMGPGTEREATSLYGGAPLRGPQGEITGAVITVTDVTALRNLQQRAEALAERAQQQADDLDIIIDTIPGAIVVLDRDGRPVRQNAIARGMFGWSELEQGLTWGQRMAGRVPRTSAGEPLRIDELPAARSLRGEVVTDMVLCLSCDEHDLVWLLVNSAPLRATDGTLTGTVTTYVDITQLQELTANLQTANAALAASNEALAVLNEGLQAGTEELQRAQQQREEVLTQQQREGALLHLINEAPDMETLVREAGDLLCEWFGCDALGVRWRSGDDFPFLLHTGLSDDFVAAENSLRRREAGDTAGRDEAALECLCGSLLSCPDLALPSTSGGGSFWTNSVTRLLATSAEAQAVTRPRGRCVREGFESMARIPLRFGEEVCGLLQLDSRQPDRFTAEGIALLERLAGSLALRLGQHETQQALLESEQRYRTIGELMPFGVWMSHPDGTNHYVSQSLLDLLGMDRQQYEDAPFDSLVHPDDQLACEALFGVAVGSPADTPWSQEFRLRAGDGHWHWILARGVRTFDARGEFTGYLGVNIDIQELKEAQQEAQQRADELDVVLSSMPDGVMIYNADGTLRQMNEAAREPRHLRQVPSNSALSDHVQGLRVLDQEGQPLPPEQLPTARALRGEVSHFVVTRVEQVDGTWNWFAASSAPLRNPAGEITGAVTSFRDITELREMQAEREHLAERLSALVETMPAGVLMCDVEGEFTLVNEHMREMMDIAVTGDASGPTAGYTLHHADGSQYAPEELPLMQSLSQDRTVSDMEMVFHLPTGTQVFTLASASPLHDSEGNVLGAVAVVRDITALHLAQEELRTQRAFLQGVLDQMPSGVLVIEPGTTRVLLANRSIAAIWGQEMAGVLMADFLGAMRATGADGELRSADAWPGLRALRQGEEIHNEIVRVTRPDGKIMHVSANAAPVRDERGQIVAAIVAATDVTEAVQAQDELRMHRDHLEDLVAQRTTEIAESERRYRELVESASSAIIQYDASGTMTLVNRYAEELFGYEPGELLGQQVMILVPPVEEATGRNLAGLRDAILADPKAFETSANENITKDGRRLWMIWANRVVLDGDGNFEAMMGIGLDRTAHHEAEKELRRLNRVYTVLSRANETIVRVRTRDELFSEICRVAVEEGRFRMAWIGLLDPASGRVVPQAHWGHEEGYLSGIKVNAATTPEGLGPTGVAVRDGVHQVSNDIANDPRMTPWAEHALRRGYRSSGAFPFHSGTLKGTVNLYADEPGFFDEQRIALLQALALNLAIALEREEAAQGLLTYQNQLRQLASELSLAEERERRRLAASIHDDLIQNLAFAKMKLALTRQANQSADVAEGIEGVGQLLDEAIRYTRGLTFEMSLPILYQLGFEPALEWLTEHMAERHGYAVRLVSNGQPRTLSQDVNVTLFQAVRELLTNAAKHAQATEIVVTARWQEDQVEIEVADDGVGFEVGASESGVTGGFGLFHLQERLRYLGGQLVTESTPGTGAKFTLIVPLPPE